MKEDKKSKNDWLFGCGGCLGIIIILGLVLFLFMGCMADMTEEQEKEDKKQVSKEKKESTKKENKEQKQATVEKEKTEKNESSNDSKNKPSKSLTDEDKLKKNIKDESVTLKDLEFVNGGDEIHITIEASSAMSKKSTLRVMKVKTADTLYALKKSGLNFSTANIYVSPPDEEQYAMTSRWTYDDVNEIDEDSTYTLPDEMEEKADGFMLNSYFR